jgi:hypothetical protein
VAAKAHDQISNAFKGWTKPRKPNHSLVLRAQFLMQPQILLVVVLFICTLPFGLGYGEREADHGTRCQDWIQNEMKTTTSLPAGGIGLEL